MKISEVKGVRPISVRSLKIEGYDTVEQVQADPEGALKCRDVGKKAVHLIINAAPVKVNELDEALKAIETAAYNLIAAIAEARRIAKG